MQASGQERNGTTAGGNYCFCKVCLTDAPVPPTSPSASIGIADEDVGGTN